MPGKLALLALLLTVTPAVGGASLALPVGGGSLFYSDLALPAVAVALFSLVVRQRGAWVAWALIIAAGILILEGKSNRAEFRWIVRDARPAIYAFSGAVIGLYLARDREQWMWHLRATTIFFAVVATLVAISQIQPVVGNASASNSLIYGVDVTRLSSRRTQIETDPAAMLVLAGIFGAYIAQLPLIKQLGRRTYWTLLVSVIVIIFLSYSRNTLLGLGVAALCGAIVPTGALLAERWVRLATKTLVAAVVIIPLAYLVVTLGLFASQVDTYGLRVVGGLTSTSLATDASVLWRKEESALAWETIRAHPITGQGLGVFYRPHVIGEAIVEEGGRLYVHNYYLWALVKGGLLYLLLLVAMLGGGCAQLLLRSTADRTVSIALGCGLAGVLACAFVAPWPSEPYGAAIVFAVAAAGFTLARDARSRPRPGLPLTTQKAIDHCD